MDANEAVEKENADGRRTKMLKGHKPAQSFRLGIDYIDRLKLLADRRDVSQVEVLRDLIDKEWALMQAMRKRRTV